jgi:hypothetical protein
MTFPKIAPAMFLLASLIPIPGFCADGPDRTSLVCSGVTVFYDRKDEAFAREFGARLPSLLQAERAAVTAPGDISLSAFKKNRDVYLATIARYLGLEKPTKGMRQVFDSMVKADLRLEEALATALKVNTVQIWHEEALMAHLRTQGEDDYFTLGKDNSLPVAKNTWNAPGTPKGAARVVFEGTTRKQAFLPVILRGDDPANLGERVEFHLKKAADFLSKGLWRALPYLEDLETDIALHEVVEMKLVSTFISSPDRRWFCEGMANFIAYRALVEATTPERARRHYDLAQQLSMWGKMEKQIDLEHWKVVDDMTAAEQDSDLNKAHYAYATKVIADIYEKHGAEFFPRWVQEIAKTPREKATMKTVADAFERLTGEKLATYYPRPFFSTP